MITDPDLLDIVRRLRNYMVAFDNVNVVLEKTLDIDDATISDPIHQLIPDVVSSARNISAVLKKIESSRQYRDLVKRYNLEEEQDENEES